MNQHTELSSNELLIALNQQKKEQCAIFCARLNKISFHIRQRGLTASECAELLDQESELIKQQHEGSSL